MTSPLDHSKELTHQQYYHDDHTQESSSQENKDDWPVWLLQNVTAHSNATCNDATGSCWEERASGGTLGILGHHSNILQIKQETLL